MQSLVIVNASPVLSDTAVMAVVEAMQVQVNRDFLPAWGDKATPVTLSFAPASSIGRLPEAAWPVYLNRHSTEEGALGWHDDQGRQIFSRVFVGDCMRFRLDWRVTLSHEILEMILDPDIKRVWKMADGRFAGLEACDAVEADEYGYDIDGVKVSDFVLPAYFGAGAGPYDFRDFLKGACPTLLPGGYMPVTGADGQWTQVEALKDDGFASTRALVKGHRRQFRAVYGSEEV